MPEKKSVIKKEKVASPIKRSTDKEVDLFLGKLSQIPRGTQAKGRLIFALDATASRQMTWDHACHIQAMMFEEAGNVGGLEIQLIFYRGFRECKASSWVEDTDRLSRLMTSVSCLAGNTQIEKVFKRAISETNENKVNAVVFVGDAMEEDIDTLGHLAGQLGLHGVPCFMFHEGSDQIATTAFKQFARLSGGAYCSFDEGAAQQLKDLLTAVAVFAAGGRKALADYSQKNKGKVAKLLSQIPQ
ncbi:VWA domain-containing protein [Kiloniella sp. EL199]|uniref:VWA domain-containing protein n=1 Tax=Kiloniella sp. EL199 TaxID=2107581 RepID=UPI0020B16739|nr:VWA domain-containing protein [Kiloniella sp. EL199]